MKTKLMLLVTMFTLSLFCFGCSDGESKKETDKKSLPLEQALLGKWAFDGRPGSLELGKDKSVLFVHPKGDEAKGTWRLENGNNLRIFINDAGQDFKFDNVKVEGDSLSAVIPVPSGTPPPVRLKRK